MTDSDVGLSTFLSYVLRHRPEAAGITLDAHGWVVIDDLLRGCDAVAHSLSRSELLRIVDTSPKKRFSLSADGLRIRASQGHSVAVDLRLTHQSPPDVLYHGTATRFLPSILSDGLQPCGRTHVHLSADQATAHQVGGRHGKPVLLVIETSPMLASGFRFLQAENGVWLIDQVPSAFFTVGSFNDADSATTSKEPNPSR